MAPLAALPRRPLRCLAARAALGVAALVGLGGASAGLGAAAGAATPATGSGGGARAAAGSIAGRRLQGLRGHPDCPCVNPWEALGGLPPDLTYVDPATGAGCLKYTPANGTPPLCYPLDYGASECRAWDKNLPPLCAQAGTGEPFASAAKSCGDLWCYVNRSRCTPSPWTSSRFPMLPELSYSTETCGSVNHFASELLVKSLRGRVMRVGVPSDEGEWPLLVVDKSTGAPSGISTDFLEMLAAEGEFRLSFRDISQDSLEAFPQSTYSACARDVALRRLDFCTGFFWDTPQRRLMATYAPPYYQDLIYLVAFQESGRGGLFEMLVKVFEPLSLYLWLAIVAFCLSVGLAMWALGEVGDVPPLRGGVRGLRLAMLQLFGQGGFSEVESRAGQIVLFGFGFLCMVVLASYTANLSSFLLVKNLKTGIIDMADAVSQGKKICEVQALGGLVANKFPSAKHLVVDSETNLVAVKKMGAQECDVMLLSEREYNRLRAGDKEYGVDGARAHCNKMKVGDPVLSVDMGFPIQRDIEQAMGYLMAKAKAEGALDDIAERYSLGQARCQDQGQVLEDDVQAMSISDLTGVLVITGAMLVLGLLMQFYDRRVQRRALAASASGTQAFRTFSRQSDGGGAATPPESRLSTPASAPTARSLRVVPLEGSFSAKAAIKTISHQVATLTEAVEALAKDNAALREGQAVLCEDSAAMRKALARLASLARQEGPAAVQDQSANPEESPTKTSAPDLALEKEEREARVLLLPEEAATGS